jgi:glycosyltransferase involved in cell wall biosynthesis
LKLYPSKSILIPTAEKDKLLDLPLFRQELNLPAGIIYLTNEEKDILEKSAANTGKPNIISACGINIKRPDQKTINDFLRRYDIKKPFLLYVGRIDPNKGCMQLFDFYTAFKRKNDIEIDLILLGKKMMEIPERSDIKSLGFVNDEDKYAAISSADILLMPSFFESLSIVLLEAWALGSVTLANGLCDVLKGQTKRSNAGLYYGNYLEFEEGLKILLKDKSLKISLGENGKNFIQEHYNWDKISFEYRDFINRIINESQ